MAKLSRRLNVSTMAVGFAIRREKKCNNYSLLHISLLQFMEFYAKIGLKAFSMRFADAKPCRVCRVFGDVTATKRQVNGTSVETRLNSVPLPHPIWLRIKFNPSYKIRMEAIKRLSDRSEFFITLFLVFGFPSFYSFIYLIAFLQGYGGPISFNNYSLINLLELEILTGGAAGAFLYIRYWRIAHFHINMGWSQTLAGTVVFVVILILQYVTAIILKGVFETEGQISTRMELSQISLTVTIAVCFINSFFEEVFVVGYIVQSLRKNHDAMFVVTLSAAIRTLYHLYQGPIAINIFFMGLLHAYLYWRWKSLWPLIVAHGALNFMAFGLAF